MTRLSTTALGLIAAALVAVGASSAQHAAAQCCGTPTVAYSPVVAPAVTVVDAGSGWYPGRMLDRMRMRRWAGAATVAPTYAAAYTPYAAGYAPYTAGYAPYTAAYAPATYASAYAPPVYTSAYRPYVTSYAPLQPVVQTSYMPVTTVDSTCSSCSYTSLRPVVTTYAPAAVAPACGCAAEAPCSACAGAAVVDQAGYVQSTPACSSCAETSGVVQYSDSSSSVGASTGQPQLPLHFQEPDRANSNYPSNGATAPPAEEPKVDPKPLPPEEETPAESATSFEAPPLLPPANGDRTANRPTVDVHNAVYRQPVRTSNAATTSAKPVVNPQAAVGAADGWHSVPRSN